MEAKKEYAFSSQLPIASDENLDLQIANA